MIGYQGGRERIPESEGRKRKKDPVLLNSEQGSSGCLHNQQKQQQKLPATGVAAAAKECSQARMDCRVYVHGALPRARCQWKLWEGPSLPLPTFTLSTVEQSQQPESQKCVRVHLALNATGIKGLELHYLILSTNRSGWLQVLKRRRHQAYRGNLWQIHLDCFPAESGQKVLVSLETIPDGVLSINQSILVTSKQMGPDFHHTWLPGTRAIEVSVSEDPAITVRLCHQLALVCEELRQPFHQQVRIASYEHHDGVRKKVCPFQDQPETFGPDLWSSMQFHDFSNSKKAEMMMSLNGRCFLQPTASLCWKETPEAICQDIPNATTMGSNQEYIFEEVDVHPQLCFKFSYKNTSHTECPHQTETAWNVSLSATFLQLHLNFRSSIPASFSSALCQKQPTGQCELEPPIYTVTHVSLQGSAPGDLDLILPWRALRSCLLVWRSDVRFAGKQLLCPDVSHKRWGLLAFGVSLGLGLLVAIVLLIRWSLQRFHRDMPSRHHSRPILLIYSPDSEEHKQLVCAFAGLLHSALGCPILLDLWELAHVGRLGIMAWMYAQRELVGQEQGQVLLLWSAGSAHAYGLWRGKANGDGGKAPEPHDLFGAAMACLQGELQSAAGTMQQSDWAIAYFSKLCGRRDIPRALRFLPRYRLPQELPGLVKVLQGPSSSAPSWFHASAKALVCRLLKAEQRKGPRSRLYHSWKTTSERLTTGSLVPLNHTKLRRPRFT
ncbi:hypothetical protein JD844_013259 [Phrynosoma platyrhinos]|uniref:SEFIR domain-containing protein n=1 Tax=Phrynosoma platyrhinos TaxID=52577 RepID=A0ABQ7TKK3_PHRPL|nr:hypothetical protein JD844_013259 [Phrynosoma platyrhinos]